MSEFDSIYVAGEWRRACGTNELPLVSPYTEAVLTHVREASEADVDIAVRAAQTALPGWSATPVEERCAVMERIKAGLAARRDELIEKAVMTLSQPISRARQVSRVDSPIENAIAFIRDMQLEFQRDDRSGSALVRRRPVGVVAAICPWNAPTLTEVSKTVPAMLAGCPVVLKPDPQTPFAARILAEVADEAGLPPGVLNVVFGGGGTGEALVRHPLVRMVTFTGSAATGSAIGTICGGDFKRMVLELGGKSALVVLDDADLDAVTAAADAGNYRNSGQACIGLTRIVAPRRLYAEVVDRLAERARAYVLGDPMLDTTTMGPLVRERQRDRMLGLIEGARREGARLVTGGVRPKDQPRGWFVEPAVIADVGPDATIAQEEVFGPVATVLAYDSEAQAVAIANNSRYGLHGAVFSGDPDRALALARQVDSGTMGVNCFGLSEAAPFGGVKCSGVGREHGPEGVAAFLEYTSYTLALGAGAVTSYARPAAR
jgi:betaine-aldehyde dehydrogenase